MAPTAIEAEGGVTSSDATILESGPLIEDEALSEHDSIETTPIVSSQRPSLLDIIIFSMPWRCAPLPQAMVRRRNPIMEW